MKLPNHTALKEWAAVIHALAAGDQILLLRKGGIHERAFEIESSRFYLLPTYLHQKEKQFKPAMRRHFDATDRGNVNPPVLPVDTWCEVVGEWSLRDLDRLLALDPYLIFTSETIQERYRFREDQAVHVVAVRAWRLPQIHDVLAKDEYAGCRSWVSIDEEIDVEGSTAALPARVFNEKLAVIGELLKGAASSLT
jgi:hypothetical protein